MRYGTENPVKKIGYRNLKIFDLSLIDGNFLKV